MDWAESMLHLYVSMKFGHSPPASLLPLLDYVAQFALGPIADRLSHVENVSTALQRNPKFIGLLRFNVVKELVHQPSARWIQKSQEVVALGRFSFLIADLCKNPVPPRSCPRDLATTDPTGSIRLSTYGARGKHGCVTHVRQARDL
jgi:hypothetical protein